MHTETEDTKFTFQENNSNINVPPATANNSLTGWYVKNTKEKNNDLGVETAFI